MKCRKYLMAMYLYVFSGQSLGGHGDFVPAEPLRSAAGGHPKSDVAAVCF